MARSTPGHDVVIAGGGAIGLSCAWRAAAAGLDVCVLERGRPGAATSAVAAGMLAPVGEASWGEEALLALGMESLRMWPDFARELESVSGRPAGFEPLGALHVALDRDEAEALRRRLELHRRLGLDSDWVRPSRCRELEPGLATGLAGGLHAPGEAAADPRELCAALEAAFTAAGGTLRAAEVSRAEPGAGGWRLDLTSGEAVYGGYLVVAAGAWSGTAQWLPAGLRPPVRPVKGEVLTLRSPGGDAPCERILAGERVYLVPRADGRLIAGATAEERGFDTTVTAGGVYELLREAYRLLPEVAELELVEARAGLRPGSPDNAPLIGLADERLVLATGHYRNGILLAPVTAAAVIALLSGEDPPTDIAAFAPGRFSPGRAGDRRAAAVNG